MNRDWDVLCHDTRAADHVMAWARQEPLLTGATNPQDVVDTVLALHHRDDREGHDRVMRLLVEHAAGNGSDAQAAWRTTVRVLLPKAVLMARSQLRDGLSWDDVCAAVFAAAFETVRTYPLHRRPRRVFNNLALDTLQTARRTLTALTGDAEELRQTAADVAPLTGPGAGARFAHLVHDQETTTPHETTVLADLLRRAVQMELVDTDEPALSSHEARAEVLDVLLWAVQTGALKEVEARRIARYYLPAAQGSGEPHLTTRAMGAEGALLRQHASRAVRTLRKKADLTQYRTAC